MPARQAVTIPVQPWFFDHCFNGRVILPAVEIMLILAEFIKTQHPAFSVQNMGEARFVKFLEIPPATTELSTFIEYEERSAQQICVRLVSRMQFKKMSRIKLHAELTFSTPRQHGASIPSKKQVKTPKRTATIRAEQIYQELVPFGPSYRSLTGTVELTDDSAAGILQAPALPVTRAAQKDLGSPFPLDGAMHAACVLGQCTAGFVPFPVGFARRTVHSPTLPGKRYTTEVHKISQTEEELLFDLFIADENGDLCESVRKLRMRDVSGGRIIPPLWIQHCLT